MRCSDKRQLLIILVFVLGIFTPATRAQIVRQFVEVPPEIILQSVANQPSSPIKFEDLKFVAYLGGGYSNCYRIRNVGTKPIVKVTIYSSDGAERTYGVGNTGISPIKPGELFPEAAPNPKSNVKEEMLPLNDELRDKLKLKGDMYGVITLMVVDVQYADGTTFTDNATYEALKKYRDDSTAAMEDFRDKNKKP